MLSYKFKVGDKVSLCTVAEAREMEEDGTSDVGLNYHMEKLFKAGKVYTVEEVTGTGNLRFIEDEHGWIFSLYWCTLGEKLNKLKTVTIKGEKYA